jgi:hypothetical protein
VSDPLDERRNRYILRLNQLSCVWDTPTFRHNHRYSWLSFPLTDNSKQGVEMAINKPMMMALFTMLVLTLLAGIITADVYAEEISCTGTVEAVTVDNVRVPDNATCTLHGTTVEGTVYVESNATLYAIGAKIDGNIQAENSTRVDVTAGSSVGGSIQIVQSGAATIDSVAVIGDVLFDSNDQALVATGNTVGGNVQAFQNTGGVHIAGNTIDGNLQCKENTPPPTGGNNVVNGSAEDQCANLEGEPPPPPPPDLPFKQYSPMVLK